MVLLIVLLSLPFLLFFLQRRIKITSVHLPPGPPGLPLVGNLHQFDTSDPRSFWKLSKQFGPLMSLRLGLVPVVVASSAKMAEEIFKTNNIKFCDRANTLAQQILSYNFSDVALSPYSNVLSREMKKICVVHFLSHGKVQNFRPIREDQVSRMTEKISKSNQPVNLSDIIVSLADIITRRVFFGMRNDKECSKKSRFQALLSETEFLLGSFFFSDNFPFLSWVDNFRGMIARLQNNFKEFDTFYQGLIKEHIDPNRAKPDHEDIIDVLLGVQKDRGFKVDLPWDNIKAMLMNVFTGGTDTVSAAIIWAMTYTVKNPSAMKKAQEEIRNLIGKKGFVDEDDVQRLPYLKAIVKETMRLQPPIPLIPRSASELCTVKGYKIPPKTLVFVNLWAVGRDPEVWENPDVFNPDRFIGSCIDFKGQHFEFTPFGAGRRMCPGMHMALATVELALGNLLYKFDWKMPDGMNVEDLDLDVQPGITMQKKKALCLMATNYI